ncbi:MAG: alpha/beta fold hydrolase [Rhodospirillaceae bacterium]|nr:alpha/beta fold hydrolase [Rhodospirillaceae bacterium]MBT7233837.1 alpha/beta fold hydrolase [Rhodospirillaceae bacterium]
MSYAVRHLERSPEGDQQGGAAVLLHGVGGDAESWKYQLDFLGQRYRTATWDMPGYGGSALSGGMSFAGLADALIGLLDHLGLAKVHLVGHSLGGMVAQEAAAAHPGRFISLILSATSPAFGRPDGDFQKQFVASRMKPLDDGRSMTSLAEIMVPEMIGRDPNADGVALALKSMAAVSTETYRAAMQCLVTFDRRGNLPNIAMPTLLIAGENDTNAPAPMMEKMASKIPGAQYVCIPGAGHLANLERPDEFNRIVGDFIGGV